MSSEETPRHPDVRGRCPACGSSSLFLASGGYVTCRISDCKDPGAAADMLLKGPNGQAERAEIVARTVFADDWNALAHTAAVVSLLVDPTDEETAAAWLHDVVEDTGLTLSDLEDLGFSVAVISAVDLLTRHPHMSYEQYKHQLLTATFNGVTIARKVKLADARQNLARCESAKGVPKWERLADTRYRPMIHDLQEILQ